MTLELFNLVLTNLKLQGLTVLPIITRKREGQDTERVLEVSLGYSEKVRERVFPGRKNRTT